LGLDAYRHLDHLSFLDLVSRAAGQTTADPVGGNADSSNIVRPQPGGGSVLLDQAGPGIITFLRMQEAAGGPWQLAVDGAPAITINPGDLGQPHPADGVAAAFPSPLSFNPSGSHGSSLIMAPIPFRRSASWASTSKNGNFYSLLRRLPYGTPLTSWSPTADTQDVVNLLQSGVGASLPPGLAQKQGQGDLKPKTDNTIVELGASQQEPHQVRMLHFAVPSAQAADFGNSTLKIWWDGELTPSVDAPVKFVAGAGAGVYQPAGLLGRVQPDATNQVNFDLYWPMPYRHTARIALTPDTTANLQVSWQVATEPLDVPKAWWAPFHATYTPVPNPPVGQDLTFLDAAGSGRVVGTVVNFSEVGGTLEGNPRIYLDDANTPQVQATGTEEWGLGGDYWQGGKQTSLPMGGYPSNQDGAALYRWLVADSIPFNRHVRVTWEHGVADSSTLPYRAAVLWYGVPTATAIPSDDFRPGRPDEAANHQLAGSGLRTGPVSGGYAYRPDDPIVTETLVTTTSATSGTTSPPTTSTPNTTRPAPPAATPASSAFTLAVAPGATGAFLRRTYDSTVPDQRVDVYVDGSPAGSWYSAGTASGTDRHGVLRRWVDDELPLPPALIKDKRSIRIELRNANQGSWTAARYQLYSVVPRGCAG
jgi:hypothetical protein